MEMDTQSLDRTRDTFKWWLQQIGVPYSRFTAECPDYLIISPPKTGSTWLADNLRRHLQVFVPTMKEIKYFSSFFKSLDLGWYLDQIAPGTGRVKGEASPSYALLPVERIQLIRSLMPNVKIVFLMRDPIGRAWSHAKHNYRYREANFTGCTAAFDAVDERDWIENFTQEYTLAGGDYLGQLWRWLAVFPREQIYVGFFESIAREPEKLFRDVLAFFGLDPDIDLHGYPLRERIFPGLDREPTPGLRQALHGLLHRRSVELAEFLRERLDLVPPPEWQEVLLPAQQSPICPPAAAAVFARELDDRFLADILEREEAFPSAWCPQLGAYQGFNLVYRRGSLYALHVDLGDVQPDQIGEEGLRRYQAEQKCFVAPSLRQVRALVDQHVFEQYRANLPSLQAIFRETRERLAAVETATADNAKVVRKVVADLRWFKPFISLANRFLLPIARRAKRVLQAKTQGQAQPAQAPTYPRPALLDHVR